MNELNHHSLPLNAFVNGLLSEEESEKIIIHASQCESCLEELDQLWEASQFTLLQKTPQRDMQITNQLEQQVFRSLHREVMWGQLIWLATKGTLQVLFGVLRPFFNLQWSQIFKARFQNESMAASSASGKE